MARFWISLLSAGAVTEGLDILEAGVRLTRPDCATELGENTSSIGRSDCGEPFQNGD